MSETDNEAVELFLTLFEDDEDECFESKICFNKIGNVYGEDWRWSAQAKVFAIQREASEDYPWVEYSLYNRYFVFDKNGKVVARGSTIKLTNLFGELEEDIKTLQADYDAVIADWGRLFFHHFFIEEVNNVTTMLFIEDIWVDETLRGLGLGKWLVEEMIKHSIEGLEPKDRVVVGLLAYPRYKETKFKDKDFTKDEKGLIKFYQQAFKSVQNSSLSKHIKYTFKKDVSKDDTTVIFWKME